MSDNEKTALLQAIKEDGAFRNELLYLLLSQCSLQIDDKTSWCGEKSINIKITVPSDSYDGETVMEDSFSIEKNT
jgi:hypothetical protein